MENAAETPSSALVPMELIRKATDIASVCKEIVSKTAMEIQGRKYVKVEGWQSIATAHGCTASAREVEKVPGGVRAIGEIRRIDNGQVIATAEGFVGEDEPTWFGGVIQTRNGEKTLPKRPDYAIRAMAQTRAISRACRTAFAHVVVMMDAGLSTTPAEEIPHDGSGGFEQGSGGSSGAKNVTPEKDVPRDADGNYLLPEGVRWEDVKIHFGKNRGMKLGEVEERTRSWYLDKWQPKPYGQNTDISFDDKMLLAAVNAWADEEAGKGS